ncbi:hypothetical protein N7931_01930 [Catenovulum sp. 2E275]|uniref:hypothetical protein n=1 Tax=Catenovulum sp. 2E275 TaxID=2980497 RepID=UPI0021CE0129|nr:hypothetical protein [Catenovulum sp. 2E275]MCU4674378.1 hypothetical protein [Catenovulum sp. 2E275]
MMLNQEKTIIFEVLCISKEAFRFCQQLSSQFDYFQLQTGLVKLSNRYLSLIKVCNLHITESHISISSEAEICNYYSTHLEKITQDLENENLSEVFDRLLEIELACLSKLKQSISQLPNGSLKRSLSSQVAWLQIDLDDFRQFSLCL